MDGGSTAESRGLSERAYQSLRYRLPTRILLVVATVLLVVQRRRQSSRRQPNVQSTVQQLCTVHAQCALALAGSACSAGGGGAPPPDPARPPRLFHWDCDPDVQYRFTHPSSGKRRWCPDKASRRCSMNIDCRSVLRTVTFGHT